MTKCFGSQCEQSSKQWAPLIWNPQDVTSSLTGYVEHKTVGRFVRCIYKSQCQREILRKETSGSYLMEPIAKQVQTNGMSSPSFERSNYFNALNKGVLKDTPLRPGRMVPGMEDRFSRESLQKAPELLGFNLKVEERQHAVEEISLVRERPMFWPAYRNKRGFIKLFSATQGWLHLAIKGFI